MYGATFASRAEPVVRKLPKPIYNLLWRGLNEVRTLRDFSTISLPLMGTLEQWRLHRSYLRTTLGVSCPHSNEDILYFIHQLLLRLPMTSGDIIECGAYKGGSTSKISHIAKKLGRKLLVADSFQGLPENDEVHEVDVFGNELCDPDCDHPYGNHFPGGRLSASMAECVDNVRRYGEVGVCEWLPGWFEDTLPEINRPLAAIYLDCDLASSTKTCLKHLWPLLVPGGILVSQDGCFGPVLDVYQDDKFWENEVGCKRPAFKGLYKSRMVMAAKTGGGGVV